MTGFPEVTAGERTMLEQLLDFHREGVLRVLDDIGDAEAAAILLPATGLTIGGIVKHLSRVEDLWFQKKLRGVPMPEPWATAPLDTIRDWDFRSSRHDSVDELRALYLAACARSRAAAATFRHLNDLAAQPSFGAGPVSLRWILVHMIEETAQHRGHLDLLLDALRQTRARTPFPIGSDQ